MTLRARDADVRGEGSSYYSSLLCSIRARLLKRASEPFCALAVAELKWPDEGGWRGLFDVPFERCSERIEFRSQAEARFTADQNGSGL